MCVCICNRTQNESEHVACGFFYTIRSIRHVRYDYTYGTGKMEKDGFGRFIIHTYIYYHVLTRSPPTPLLNRGVVLSVALLD